MSQLNFRIGDEVLVMAITEMGYNQEKYRCPFRVEFQEPQLYIVVGAVRRRLGEYIPQQRSHSYYSDEGPEPAELRVTGTVLLYRLRSGMFGKEINAAVDDVTVVPEFYLRKKKV